MLIAVIGAGGVGGAFGAALAGAEVTFVVRGTHLTAMQTSGRVGVTPNHHMAELDNLRAKARKGGH